MTLKALMQHMDWPDLSAKFLEIFPEAEKDLEGYKTVFEKLTEMEPQRMDMTIVVAKEKGEDEEYIEVSGLHNNPKNQSEKYLQGIELVPWRNWLGMDISSESLDSYSPHEIIIRCLDEMTFFGFHEEDIQKKIGDKNQ